MGVDQALLTAAILNLAINARNAMPNEGRTRLVALETREGGSDGETHAVGAVLMMLIVDALCSRPSSL
jgi:hypothetical protein